MSLLVAVPAGVAAVVVAAIFGAWLKPPAAPQARSSVARVVLPLLPGTEMSDGPTVAISPDGTQVAYVAIRSGIPELYLRPMNGLEARVIRDTRGATGPFFSPDGQWLGFFADGKLKKVSMTGGVVVTLTETGRVSAGGAGDWAPDDTIVFLSSRGVSMIPAGGGQARDLTTPEQKAAAAIRSVAFLPDGKTLLVVSSVRGASTVNESSIEVLTIKTGQRKTLMSGSTYARYLPSGHMVFMQAGTLMAVPLDLTRLELSGSPVEVMSGIRQQQYTGVGAFSCSRGGTCVYLAGGAATSRTIALVDRSGVARPLPLQPRSYTHPRFSPTGDRISWWLEQFRCDIEVYDMARGTVARLTSDYDNHFPIWSPDGRRITYITGKGDGYEIVSKLANGSGSEERLPGSPQNLSAVAPLSWSPLGVLAFVDRGQIWLLPRAGEGQPRPFESSKFTETAPAFSPDGRWLAYVSDESGRVEVYVRPSQGSEEKYPISSGGGSTPVWARSGRELFFRNGDRMMVVDVGTTPAFTAGRPRLLFTGAFIRRGNDAASYDVSPDGKSFVMINSGEDDRAAGQITAVFNWFEELKQRVPVK